MYLSDYIWFLVAIGICMLFATYASVKVSRTFSKYDGLTARSGMTGYDTVALLMRNHSVSGISIGKVSGTLTDHYHPTKRIVNLSESTYSSNSVAAVAVAAHEMGHVLQKKDGYLMYKIRTALVPVVNLGSRLAMPLVIVGLLVDIFANAADPDIGFYIALVGVIMYGGSFIFALATLPVELNASRRAKKMLVEDGVLTEEEVKPAGKVLSAAAMTYLASLLISLVYFLRFFILVLTLFGRRNSR